MDAKKGKSSQNCYRIIDSRYRERGFPEHPDARKSRPWWNLKQGTRAECMRWIIEGLSGTEGAERDHYIDLLLQLKEGNKELDYSRV